MKVMTILGTRPEIIRLSRIIEKLDRNMTLSARGTADEQRIGPSS